MQVDVFWSDHLGQLQKNSLTLELAEATTYRVGDVISKLPASLQDQISAGFLEIACFGLLRTVESPLLAGDRIELLGPVLLDVKAERSARVKAARARERGPYNRSFSGVSTSKKA
jgi:putative ubiquitin-RnfH superfamily antitoxin RatB of RatAB toxin-antitoxin module